MPRSLNSDGKRILTAMGRRILGTSGPCCCGPGCGCGATANRDPEVPIDNPGLCDCDEYALDVTDAGPFTLKRAYGVAGDFGDASGEPGALPGAKYFCCAWSSAPNQDDQPDECTNLATLLCDTGGAGWRIDVNYNLCTDGCIMTWGTDSYGDERPSTTFADWAAIGADGCEVGRSFTLACNE